jgi:hypothetical protein
LNGASGTVSEVAINPTFIFETFSLVRKGLTTEVAVQFGRIPAGQGQLSFRTFFMRWWLPYVRSQAVP